MIEIRPMTVADLPAALKLNNASTPAVTPCDETEIFDLLAMSDGSWVADDSGALAGLLIALAPGTPYDSQNYRWISDRYTDFAYVDRIIVSPIHRRLGLAERLYSTLVDHARSTGRPHLLCEVNVEPPNPQSISFHTALGWEALEDRQLSEHKTVRYFRFPLGDGS